jgi:hypothetical protein
LAARCSFFYHLPFPFLAIHISVVVVSPPFSHTTPSKPLLVPCSPYLSLHLRRQQQTLFSIGKLYPTSITFSSSSSLLLSLSLLSLIRTSTLLFWRRQHSLTLSEQSTVQYSKSRPTSPASGRFLLSHTLSLTKFSYYPVDAKG